MAHVELAYEGPINNDNDNDGEPRGDLGALWGRTHTGPDQNPDPRFYEEDPAFQDIAAIYLETIRDSITASNSDLAGAALNDAILRFQERVVLHEIGHQFLGSGHAPGDVMAGGRDHDKTVDAQGNFDPQFEKFKDENLKIIRSIRQP